MIKPAIAAEITESTKRIIDAKSFLLNNCLYPVEDIITSNNIEVDVKPKKWMAFGLNIKFIMVAMKPTNVAVPSFLTHHTASIRAAKPIRSQRNGKWNNWKKTGDIVTFRTPQRAPKIVMPVRSRLLK